MKLIDYANAAAIQALIVTTVAYLVSPYFFRSSLGIIEVSAAFLLILFGYLMSIPLFRLFPKSVSPNFVVLLIIGFLIAIFFSGAFVLLHIFLDLYREIRIQTGVGFIAATTSAAIITTWVMRHVT